MPTKFKNALVSVSDKAGLVDFLKPLQAQGLRIVSTGGTAKHLRDNGLKVVEVAEQTGFPEVMDGRVRTLHPNIHMALLARQNVSEDMQLLKKFELEPFDLVIGNLYPFEESLKKNLPEHELIEYIDVGGPSLLRAAAKNFSTIAVVCDPADYAKVSDSNSLELRKSLAAKVYFHCSAYDAMVAQNLCGGVIENDLSFGGKKIQSLRYGENPHQPALWYRSPGQNGWHEAKLLQGKELSYNNLLDLEAAIRSCPLLPHIGAAGVKHNNPCGVALGKSVQEATDKMLKADPVSIFGGIVAINQPVDGPAAETLSPIFLECIVAPSFTSEAQAIFQKKKNLRILQWDFTKVLKQNASFSWEIKPITGGWLVQAPDSDDTWSEDWKIIGQAPNTQQKQDLLLAWNVCRQLKSNAISIIKNGQTLGLGMGQVNRIDSVKHAIERAFHHHAAIAQQGELILASDGFFPFADSVDFSAKAKVKWIIQPGGSIKDEEVIQSARDHGINMILTGRRHFKH
ncbi:MAG: bifunctional phosphoribosylaminoimidazolecarboxamide formyltransferase/IMP cyclohydrolase [Bdellovibrionales bacterium]